MTKTQKSVSGWLMALWCLGAFSPTIVFLFFKFQPHFPLPNRSWQPFMFLTGFATSVCAATFMQFSVPKRIGLVLLAALVMAIQLAAIMFYAVSHLPEPT
ncbi:MAG: hypothetical protein WCS94_02335 [Verrucomicrobiota bacterium]